MDNNKINKWLNIIVTSIFMLAFGYIVYIVETATRAPGCTNSYEMCVSSHMETDRSFYGKYWHTREYEVCDKWKTITHDCDCVTYHWFWGDSKNQ